MLEKLWSANGKQATTKKEAEASEPGHEDAISEIPREGREEED